MSDTKQNQSNRALITAKHTVSDLLNSDRAKTEIAKVLPKHLTAERMTRVALTATLKNPALLECLPQSLMNALLVCSQAGLEPDGRLAHLIPFGNQVQVIFDYKGLVTLALRNGAEAVFADKVCEHDFFEAAVIDGRKVLTHKPNFTKARGNAYCYYAICKRAGEVDWEVMTLEEVDEIRQRSRAKDKGPWVTDFDEMAKKTVLRRMSKRWDLLPEIRDVINADDDTPPPFGGVIPKRPVFQTQQSPEIEIAPPAEPAVSDEEAEAAAGLAPSTAKSAAEVVPGVMPKVQTVTEQAEKEAPLKLLRHGLKAAKIKEGVLLGYLTEIGLTDGSSATLEEVMLAPGGSAAIQKVLDNWQDFSQKIIQATKA